MFTGGGAFHPPKPSNLRPTVSRRTRTTTEAWLKRRFGRVASVPKRFLNLTHIGMFKHGPQPEGIGRLSVWTVWVGVWPDTGVGLTRPGHWVSKNHPKGKTFHLTSAQSLGTVLGVGSGDS